MQRSGDGAMKSPGLDHWGQNRKEQPKHTEHTRRTRLDHPGRSKQQEPPPPGLEHSGTSGSRRPGLHHPGQNKKERPQPEGQDHPGKNGLPPRARLPGAKQAGRVPNPQARASRGKWQPEAKETRGQDQGGAAMESCPEAMQRTMPWRCREAEMRTRPRRHSAEDETVVKRRNRPMNQAAVMQRSSHENKAVVL